MTRITITAMSLQPRPAAPRPVRDGRARRRGRTASNRTHCSRATWLALEAFSASAVSAAPTRAQNGRGAACTAASLCPAVQKARVLRVVVSARGRRTVGRICRPRFGRCGVCSPVAARHWTRRSFSRSGRIDSTNAPEMRDARPPARTALRARPGSVVTADPVRIVERPCRSSACSCLAMPTSS